MAAFISVVITSATTIHFPDIDSLPVIFHSLAPMLALRRQCDERSEEANPLCQTHAGLLRGDCHRARVRPVGLQNEDRRAAADTWAIAQSRLLIRESSRATRARASNER